MVTELLVSTETETFVTSLDYAKDVVTLIHADATADTARMSPKPSSKQTLHQLVWQLIFVVYACSIRSSPLYVS